MRMVLILGMVAVVWVTACDDDTPLAEEVCDRVDSCSTFQDASVEDCEELLEDTLEGSVACEERLQSLLDITGCRDLVEAFVAQETIDVCDDFSVLGFDLE